MIYYKVLPQYDGRLRMSYKLTKEGYLMPSGYLIANELYTKNEMKRISNNPLMFKMIEIPKTKTYKSFGARFEMRKEM